MCAITLQRMNVSDIGRQLMGSLLPPFLKTWMTLANDEGPGLSLAISERVL